MPEEKNPVTQYREELQSLEAKIDEIHGKIAELREQQFNAMKNNDALEHENITNKILELNKKLKNIYREF